MNSYVDRNIDQAIDVRFYITNDDSSIENDDLPLKMTIFPLKTMMFVTGFQTSGSEEPSAILYKS